MKQQLEAQRMLISNLQSELNNKDQVIKERYKREMSIKDSKIETLDTQIQRGKSEIEALKVEINKLREMVYKQKRSACSQTQAGIDYEQETANLKVILEEREKLIKKLKTDFSIMQQQKAKLL